MTKTERRDLIKQVYPQACAGDRSAITKLRQLMHPRVAHSHCTVCSVPIGTHYPGAGRCRMHDPRRVYMRGKRLLALLANSGNTVARVGSRRTLT